MEKDTAASMMQMIMGAWVSPVVSTAAELGISDSLLHGPLTTEELATALSVNKDYLFRLMRCLEALGIYASDQTDGDQQKWMLTPMGRLLISSEGSLRYFAMMALQAPHSLSWSKLPAAIKTGKPGVELAFNEDIWTVFRENFHWQETFDKAMSNFSATSGVAVAEALKDELKSVSKILDIGGGRGMMLAAILRQCGNDQLSGISLDQSIVIEAAKASPPGEISDVAGRIEFVAGDFFVKMPPLPANALITMKTILHDWDDEKAMAILKACYKALPCGGRIAICDTVVKTSDIATTVMDVNMLAVSGGRERTLEEFKNMLNATGFEFEKVMSTASIVSVLLATRRQ